MSGGTIYVSAEELDALHEADSILYALFEAADGEATGLKFARDGLRSVIEKTQKAAHAAGTRRLVRTALRYAETLEGGDRDPGGL
jgi:hypothetical protein